MGKEGGVAGEGVDGANGSNLESTRERLLGCGI